MYTLEMRKTLIEEISNYIIDTKATVRNASSKYHVSKTTIHMWVTKLLKDYNPSLYIQVREVLDYNKSQRASRGGRATRNKFRNNP